MNALQRSPSACSSKGRLGIRLGAFRTCLALLRKAWLSVPMWAGPGAKRCRIPPAISARVELPNFPAKMPARPMPLAKQGGISMTLLTSNSALVTGWAGQGRQTEKEAEKKCPVSGKVQLPSVQPFGCSGAHLSALTSRGGAAVERKKM